MKIPGLLIAIALSCVAGAVQAVNFNMTCTASTSTLTFNPYDVLAGTAVTTPTGSITVTCTNTANSAVTVDYSLALSTSPARQLTSGSNTLQYDLYTDPAPSAVQWGTTGTCIAGSNANAGNLICGSFSVPGKSSASQTKNYYGKINANADVPVGAYMQSGIAVTLTYSCNPAPTGGGAC